MRAKDAQGPHEHRQPICRASALAWGGNRTKNGADCPLATPAESLLSPYGNHSYRPAAAALGTKLSFPYTFLAFCIRAGQPRTAASKGEPWVGPGLAYKWPGLAWLISGLAWPGV